MNWKRELFFLSVCAFILVWTSCASGLNSSQNESYVIAPTATPIASNSDGEITKFIDKAGWHVPIPPGMKSGPKDSLHYKSMDGREILVTTTTMIGFREYRFTQDARELVRQGYPDLGEMRLLALKQLSVGTKVFSYIIVAESKKRDASSQGGDSHPSHPLYYRILDNDGDGKFETLFPGHSDNLLPRWVEN